MAAKGGIRTLIRYIYTITQVSDVITNRIMSNQLFHHQDSADNMPHNLLQMVMNTDFPRRLLILLTL